MPHHDGTIETGRERSATRPEHHAPLCTPLTRLHRLAPTAGFALYAKLDQLQLSGSVKERSATALLDDAERAGRLARGGVVIESTSGNLGVALARQCALRGHRFIAVIDERTHEAARRTMRAFGAEVDLVEVPAGSDRLAARIERVAELLAQVPGAISLDQYNNPANPRAHQRGALPEIVATLGHAPSRLYVAVSTTGTLLGCLDAIQEHGWATRVVAVDAVGSVLFGGARGERLFPGLGSGVETAHARRARPAEVRQVSEAAMVRGARLLARAEGLLVGASTGAVVSAILDDAHTVAPEESVVFIVHDDGRGYLDTLYDDDWVREFVPGATTAEVMHGEG